MGRVPASFARALSQCPITMPSLSPITMPTGSRDPGRAVGIKLLLDRNSGRLRSQACAVINDRRRYSGPSRTVPEAVTGHRRDGSAQVTGCGQPESEPEQTVFKYPPSKKIAADAAAVCRCGGQGGAGAYAFLRLLRWCRETHGRAAELSAPARARTRSSTPFPAAIFHTIPTPIIFLQPCVDVTGTRPCPSLYES